MNETYYFVHIVTLTDCSVIVSDAVLFSAKKEMLFAFILGSILVVLGNSHEIHFS